MPPSRIASGATPAITVSGAAAETTKKAMSAVPSEPRWREEAAGAAVLSPGPAVERVTGMGKPFWRRAGTEDRACGMTDARKPKGFRFSQCNLLLRHLGRPP